MKTIGNLPGERLAGLWADLAHKVQKGKISLDEIALFNQRKNPFGVGVGKANVIAIDRTKPFNPTESIGNGWSFWLGPADGNGLEGKPEQDDCSLALTEVDLSEILLEAHLKSRETSITGEERLRRLIAADRIRLDLGVFKTLWDNKEMIPASFSGRTNNNATCVFFDGQTLRSPDGQRFTLFLSLSGGGAWRWGVRWLGHDRFVSGPSAVLAR